MSARPITIRLHTLTAKDLEYQEKNNKDTAGNPLDPTVLMPRDVAPGEITYQGPKTRLPRVGTYYVPQIPWDAMAKAFAADDGSGVEMPLTDQQWSVTRQTEHVRIPLYPIEVPADAGPLLPLIHGAKLAFQLSNYCPVPISQVDLFVAVKSVDEGKKYICYLGVALRQEGG